MDHTTRQTPPPTGREKKARERGSKTVSANLSEAERARLFALARAWNCNVSEAIRRALNLATGGLP